MKRTILLIMTAMCVSFLLLPSLTWSQWSGNPWWTDSSPIALDVRVMQTRNQADLRDGQWSTTTHSTQIELNAWAILADSVRLRWALLPGHSTSEAVTPAGSFVVGATEFGQAQQAGGKQQQQKPVSLEFKDQSENRIELTALTRSPLRPVLACEWVRYELMATGEKATDSETFSRFFLAAGGLLQYQTPLTVIHVMAVGGNNYTRLEGTLFYRVRPEAAVVAGYYQESKTIGELKLKTSGPFVGASIDW